MDKNCLLCIAIICVTILEAIALFKGINGAYFTGVIAAISLLAGIKLKDVADQLKEKK